MALAPCCASVCAQRSEESETAGMHTNTYRVFVVRVLQGRALGESGSVHHHAASFGCAFQAGRSMCITCIGDATRLPFSPSRRLPRYGTTTSTAAHHVGVERRQPR